MLIGAARLIHGYRGRGAAKGSGTRPRGLLSKQRNELQLPQKAHHAQATKQIFAHRIRVAGGEISYSFVSSPGVATMEMANVRAQVRLARIASHMEAPEVSATFFLEMCRWFVFRPNFGGIGGFYRRARDLGAI